MSIEKMRAEFEAAYRAQAVERYGKEADSAVFNYHCGEYVLGYVQSAWWGWKASRAALVVELPEQSPETPFSKHMVMDASSVIEAIEAAGVQVKP